MNKKNDGIFCYFNRKLYWMKNANNRRKTLLKGVCKMKSEEIKLCEGKQAKLVLDNDYVLRGIIDRVSEDSLFFSTSEETSIIRIDAIKEIVIRR